MPDTSTGTTDPQTVSQRRIVIQRQRLAFRISAALDEIQDARLILDELIVPWDDGGAPDLALAGTPGEDIEAYLAGTARGLRALGAMIAQATAAAIVVDDPEATR